MFSTACRTQLAAGQLQRVPIARMLVRDADVFLMDEPHVASRRPASRPHACRAAPHSEGDRHDDHLSSPMISWRP